MTRGSVSWMVMLALALGGAGTSWAEGPHVEVGGGLLPAGDVEIDAGGESDGLSTETAMVLVGRFAYDVSPSARLGAELLFAPSVQIEEVDSDSGFRLLSPAVRGELRRALSPTTQLHGYGRIGYSRVSHPDDEDVATGLAVGLGMGARFAMSSSIDGFAEVGYQWASHTVDLEGPDLGIDFNGFVLTAGVSFDL